MAKLGVIVAMKGLVRGKKRLQHNIVDLFPDISTETDEVFMVNGRETHAQKY